MCGGGVDLGYRFQRARFSPRLSYSPLYYSGDDASLFGDPCLRERQESAAQNPNP